MKAKSMESKKVRNYKDKKFPWTCKECRNGIWIDEFMGHSNHKGKDGGGICVCECHVKPVKSMESRFEELEGELKGALELGCNIPKSKVKIIEEIVDRMLKANDKKCEGLHFDIARITKEKTDKKWRARIKGKKIGDIHQPNCISKAGVNNCDCATYHVNQALDKLLKE